MNRKQIIAALEAVNASRKKIGLEIIDFAHDASTSVLNGLLRRSWLTVKNSADADFDSTGYDAELTIHGQIGTDYYGDQGYSAKQFQDEIKPLAEKNVLLNLHSPGGNVWDAFAISEMVRNHGQMDTKVLGLAASSADVIFQSGANRIMPKMAMRMAHNPSALFIAHGNAEELKAQKSEYDKTIARLEKHGNTLAQMYCDCNTAGQTIDQVKSDMNAEEFMDGDESMAKGYCDCLSDDVPVTDALDLSHFKKVPSTVLNQFNALPMQGERNKNKNQQQDNQVNKTQKIALLNSWGVKLPTDKTEATINDEWLDAELAKGKPLAKIGREQNVALLNSWGVSVPQNAIDTEVESLVAKGKPPVTTLNNITNLDDHPVVKEMRKQLDDARRSQIRDEITKLASTEGGMRIPLNSIEGWVERAFTAIDDPTKGNSIIADLKALEPKQIGVPPVSEIVIGDTFDIREVAKVVSNAFSPRNAMLGGNPMLVKNQGHRKQLHRGALVVAKILKKQIDAVTAKIPESPQGGFNKQRAEAITQWMENALRPLMNDAVTTYGAPGTGAGGVAISQDLQRQVIMSESMRAFKRRMLPLSSFSHTWNAVPLQGNDIIDVPYYPLFTTASQRFVTGQGYQFGNTDTADRKQIVVGGSGPAVKVSGQDRAYQALTYSAYVLRRQPWVDVQRLAVMRAEQLALDILNDIVTAWVLKANFGNAVWSGAPSGFDDTTVAALAGAARKSDWPEGMRDLVIGTDYWVNLASSPYVKAFLNIGDTGTIREGRIGGLYGFEDTIENPRIPVTQDGNLVGWISYPSAVLCATSPILPAPGEMKLMVSYDVVVDAETADEEGGTGMAFEYKYWGEPWNSADREIIECNYGSGLGELAALKRLVANGN